MDEQRKWFLEMQCTPDEDAVQIVEMTIEHLEYYINLAHKEQWQAFERTDFSFERNSTLGKMLSQQHVRWGNQSLVKGRPSPCGKLCCLILRSCYNHPNLRQLPPNQSAAANTEVRPSTSKKMTAPWRLRCWLVFFSNKVVLNYAHYIFI